MEPKVFVCHASEDEDRFVLEFGRKLRERGIDAFVDEWEIGPGDSLVRRIFEEGIGDAEAVIVVVSELSVNKPWVRQELDAAMVRHINGVSKLIPVVIGSIDESQIPETLKTIVWERIENLDDYDFELERIVMSIYGHREKPPLGEPPTYAQTAIHTLPGLTGTDSLILKLCCEENIQTGRRLATVNPETLLEQAESMDVHRDSALESLEVLEHSGYVELSKVLGGGMVLIKVTDFGFDRYARTYVPDYESVVRGVSLQILNQNKKQSREIAQALEQPQAMVDHVLNMLESNGDIKLHKTLGGSIYVLTVSPRLRRSFS
jgi:hypothetical protein